VTGEIILRPEMGITTEMAKAIVEAGICKVRVRSPLTCHSSSGACSKCYGQDLSTGRIVEEGVAVGIIAAQSIGEPGTQVALNRRHPDRKSDGNSHMLARIAELFEGRKPRENTSVNLKQLLMESGLRVAQVALLNELRDIYRTNGLCVNDKHFEIMIRKMTEKVKIEDPGDTLFLRGELVHRQRFVEENEEVQFEGRRPAGGRHTILGVTKAALSSHSWISAASFQETTKVLIEAAIKGRIDELKGLKENIVIGRLIPCGTGMQKYRDTFVKGELSSRCPRHEEEPDESY
jgi:DNA-directed RNA polymerase subunit beta'